MAKTTKTRVRVAGTNPGKAPPKSTTTKNAKAKNAETTSGRKTDPELMAVGAGKPRGTNSSTTSKGASPGGASPGSETKNPAKGSASSGEKTFTFDWGKASKEVKGQLRQLVRDGDNEGYAKLAAEKLGMSAEEAAHWFQNEANLSKRKATTGSSGSASGATPKTGGPGSPGKASVTAGAKKKSGSFKSIISGWDDATKRDYSDLIARANKGDETARGILFNGTKDGGKNKFGLTLAQVRTGLAFQADRGYAIKGYEGGKSASSQSKTPNPAGSADPSEIVADSGFNFETPFAVARRRASDPARGNSVVGQLGANILSPGGAAAWVSSKAHRMQKDTLHRIATGVNAAVGTAATLDLVGRSIQHGFGYTDLKDQDWNATEYFNPLLGALVIANSAGRKVSHGLYQYPVAERTQFAIDQENRRKEFDDLIARASRTVDSNGNPVSGADFRTAFNRVRARYADAMSAAGRLGGEELRTAAMDRARSQANASLAALSANRRFMDASYAQGDLAAVNKALRTAGYQDEIDDLGAAEDFIANAEVDDAARAKFMDTYRKTMSDRSAMSPVDRLGW